MKILVVCQYYYPEPFRITDICEELVKRGNEVTVVTGIPNYPMGEIYDGYKDKSKRDEVINGVHVHRCFTIPRKHGPIFRLLNYFSYPFSSNRYIKKLKDDYDVVIVNQLSPVMMAKAGITYKKKYNKKLILYCLDLWPESLKAGGVGENSPLFKFFYRESKKVYTQCDKILISSKIFKNYLIEKFNISEDKISYLPQYAESIFDSKDCKKKPDENIDLVFAGNIGKAQSMDTILDAAKILKDQENLYWHIVGDGQELQNVKDRARRENLDHVIFYGRRPLEDMPKYYKMADAMLVTLSGGDDFLSQTLPGKVQTYMAAGKPIIAAANGEIKEVIEKANCGYCGDADNVSQLVNNVKEFINKKEKKEFSNNSFEFYSNHYDKNAFLLKLIKYLD